MRLLIAASLTPFLFAAVAQAQPTAPAAACLRQDMVDGWKVVNDQTLIVTDRVGKKFTLSLAPGCRNLKFNQRLAFNAFSGTGLSCLGRNDLVLVPPGGGDPGQRCLIAKIEVYSGPPAANTAASHK
ncbi:MAG: DUF6491 family protein [Pseudomonadota bacterium]